MYWTLVNERKPEPEGLIIFLKTLALKNKKIFYATLVIVIILLGMVGYNIHKFIRPIPIEMIDQAFQINKQIVLQTAHLDFSVIKWVSWKKINIEDL